MKIQKSNWGLFDKKRFLISEKEKKARLRNLSLRKAIKLEESLLSSSLIWVWRKNFFADNPICLKDSLRKKT